MKTTKRAFTLALISGLILSSFNSCKKGEGDPFLSLSSRKARVAGDWTISKETTEMTSAGTQVNSDGSSSTNTSSYFWQIDGATVKMSNSYAQESDLGNSEYKSTGAGKAEAKITFKKDGTFSMTQKLTDLAVSNSQTSDWGSFNYSTKESQSVETSGTWNFLGGVESDYKNKERIVLNVLKETYSSSVISLEDGTTESSTDTYSYSNGEYMQIWHIHTLKNKEMIVDGEMNGSGNYSGSFTSEGTTETSTGTSTSTGKMSMTLTQ